MAIICIIVALLTIEMTDFPTISCTSIREIPTGPFHIPETWKVPPLDGAFPYRPRIDHYRKNPSPRALQPHLGNFSMLLSIEMEGYRSKKYRQTENRTLKSGGRFQSFSTHAFDRQLQSSWQIRAQSMSSILEECLLLSTYNAFNVNT